MKLAEQHEIGGEEREGHKSPLPEVEAEIEEMTEQGDADPHTTSTQLKS